MDYDLFICHASEDKATFVRPLAKALRTRGLKVWYDEFSLTPGMSLRASIDSGLSGARKAVVIISKAFFAKGWAQWELNGIVQLHLSGTRGAFLVPVWHGISADEVARHSPSIADIFAIRSEKGPQVAAEEVARLVVAEVPNIEAAGGGEQVSRLIAVDVSSNAAPNPARVLSLLHVHIAESLHRPMADLSIRTSLFSLTSDRRELRLLHRWPGDQHQDIRFETGRTSIAASAFEASIIMLADIQSSLRDRFLPPSGSPVKSIMAFPIFAYGQTKAIIGVACMDSEQNDLFVHESRRTFFQSLANAYSVLLGPLVQQA